MPTIALVDDDQNILTSVSMAFEAEGFHVHTYTDGAAALSGLAASPPDVAVFDIKMPLAFLYKDGGLLVADVPANIFKIIFRSWFINFHGKIFAAECRAFFTGSTHSCSS